MKSEESNSSLPEFDPNGPGIEGNLFGLPFSTDQAKVVVLPIPWDVTTSYGSGTAEGPSSILRASTQVDLAQVDIREPWTMGVAMAEIPEIWWAKSKELRARAEEYISWLENGSDPIHSLRMDKTRDEVNEQCAQLMSYVEQESRYWLDKGKVTVTIGGDHSTPLGHIRALGTDYESFGLLQIDAHADLRKDYEGFEFSHASIMHNVLAIPQISKLVQVGIRDFCQEELEAIEGNSNRIKTFFDLDIKEAQYSGKRWRDQCNEIVDELPELVYISFDIDGLNPDLCPNTGTPVPGGYSLDEIMMLFKQIVLSGRKIIGFDLCEVSPGSDEWDANVGARALYRTINLLSVSQGILKWNK